MLRYEQIIPDLCREIDKLRESLRETEEKLDSLKDAYIGCKQEFQKYVHDHSMTEKK